MNGKNFLVLEIGSFLVESFSASKNFTVVRKTMNVNSLLKEDNGTNVQFSEGGNQTEIQKIARFQDVLKLSLELFNVLIPIFQEDIVSRKKNLTLSWLCKFSKIYLFLKEYSPGVHDFSMQIFDEIKSKIEERVFDNKSTVLKALFCLIEINLSAAKFDLYHKEFIKTQLEVLIIFRFHILIFL